MNYQKIIEQIKAENQSDQENSRVIIIDGLNTWIRVCSSMPYISENGENVGGILGFMRSIAMNIRDFNATRCILVFDGKGGSQRRKKIFPEYKQNRTGKFKIKQPEGLDISDEDHERNMRWQLQRVIQYFQHLPIQIVCIDAIEADDTIAYLTHYLSEAEQIRIISTDRDFLQLVDGRVEVYSPVKKVLYTPERLESEIEFHHNNYLIYRVLTGDASDNINGVDGLGHKTLKKRYPELETTVLSVEQFLILTEEKVKLFPKIKMYQEILASKEIIERNYKLMQLNDVNISGASKVQIQEIVNTERPKTNKLNLKQLLVEDSLTSSFKNFDDWLYNSFSKLNRW